MKTRFLKVTLAILAIIALILLVAEKADGTTWGAFWIVKGIAALILVVSSRFISKQTAGGNSY